MEDVCMYDTWMEWAWEANLKRESREIGPSLPPLSPTCSRYGKLHMISHPAQKAFYADLTRISSKDFLGPTFSFSSFSLSLFHFHSRKITLVSLLLCSVYIFFTLIIIIYNAKHK